MKELTRIDTFAASGDQGGPEGYRIIADGSVNRRSVRLEQQPSSPGSDPRDSVSRRSSIPKQRPCFPPYRVHRYAASLLRYWRRRRGCSLMHDPRRRSTRCVCHPRTVKPGRSRPVRSHVCLSAAGARLQVAGRIPHMLQRPALHLPCPTPCGRVRVSSVPVPTRN